MMRNCRLFLCFAQYDAHFLLIYFLLIECRILRIIMRNMACG